MMDVPVHRLCTRLIMEWAVVVLAETLVLIGMLRWDVVRELEEEESEGLPWNEVEVGFLNIGCM
jgi:hypothetical protein